MRVVSMLVVLGACSRPPPPTCEDSGEFACFRGVFSGLLGGRIEGVEVCTPELPDVPCVYSDSDGGWKLPGLPRDTDVLVTATSEGAVETVFPQNTGWDWYDWYKVMVPQSILQSHANRTDTTLDSQRGNILFLVWEGLNIDGDNAPNVSDVVVTLAPAASDIFYANGMGLAADDLVSTSGSGSGGALNLDPGVFELSFDAPGGPCDEHSFSFAYAAGQSVPVPVLAGFTTAIDVICPAAD
jgi:hypothetical protein